MTTSELLASAEGLTLSRRKLFGLAGAAAVGMSPALRALGVSPFEMVGGDKRVAFRLDGRERWVIDTHRFAGFPHLQVKRSAHSIHLKLTHAQFPGTNLPADFTAELNRAVVGWRLKLKLALDGFQAEVPFERWLAGEVPARSRVKLDTHLCELSSLSGIDVSGKAAAEFFPNWVLQFRGTKIARLSGLGGDAYGDSLAVSLLNPGDPSLMQVPAVKRTLITMDRGKREWPLEPDPVTMGGRHFVALGSPFDVVKVEIGEGKSGGVRRALVAESSGEETQLAFQPSGDLKGEDGKLFGLPLRKPRYAVAYDPAGDQAAVVAQYDKNPVWLHSQGCSFELGDGAGSPPFEFVATKGEVEKLHCELAVLRVAAPLPGAIVDGTHLHLDSRLAFVSQSVSAASQRLTPQVSFDPSKTLIRFGPQIRASIVQLPNFTISVVRPDDLLTLDFTFMNLTLETGGAKGRLVRTDPNKTAYVIVTFPPQSIAEQAFFESAGSGYPVENDKDPDKGNTTDDPLAPLPVRSRISGPSRLAFIVPDEIKEIPYTLESLLDWTKFELSVAGTALPPPEPPARLKPAGAKAGVVAPAQVGLAQAQPGRAVVPVQGVVQQRVAPALQVKPEVLRSVKVKEKKPTAAVMQPQVEKTPLELERVLFEPNIAMQLVELLKIQEPELYQTAIEMPYRLIISPNRYAAWANALAPVEHGGRTELWHTRLGVKTPDGTVDETSSYYRTIRAIWSPDYDPKTRYADNFPFRMSLNGPDRYEIVRLTADFLSTMAVPGASPGQTTEKPYQPRVVKVNQLMLSSLGAWLNSRGTWEPPIFVKPAEETLSVEEWAHRATMGRDHYVKVVYKGFLFPFGHRASLIKITERKFQRGPTGLAAYLRQRMYIIVREPEKQYPAVGQQHEGRELPFQRLRITNVITPSLDMPLALVSGRATAAFWPRVGAADFLFHFVAEDVDGNDSEFTAPVIFVEAGAASDAPRVDQVFTEYGKAESQSRHEREMRGQKVAYAKGDKPGDTHFETATITFGADRPESKFSVESLLVLNQPPFYPTVAEAKVRISAIEQVTGIQATTRIKIHNAYVTGGFSSTSNKGLVFAAVLDTVQLAFGGAGASTEKAGGLASPSMAIGALSRSLGPVGGNVDKIVAGAFDPVDFFKGALGDVKILGGISLWDILEVVNDFTGVLDKVPKLKPIRLPDAIEASFTWKPTMKNGPNPSKPILKFASPNDGFVLDARLRQPLNAQPPTYEIKASLQNFEVHLIPEILEVVVLKFKSLSFIAKNGQKPDVSVDFDTFQFAGPLKFIDTLREYLPLDGFKDPPSLDITAQGLKLGYSLALPAITLGAMSIQNIELTAEFRLPFTGDPINFRFAFCERQNPFLLTVWIFGGGGFFGLELEPSGEGLKKVEGSFEFGGNFSLDIGVASGGVHIMAGIYFAITGQKTQLTGYVRCGGSVNVLGIITVSVEFYMELSYESPPTRVWGRATLTVEIEILFFSMSVELTVEKTFAGGGEETAFLPVAGDYAPAVPVVTPVTFEDMITQEDWESYCMAFA
jgi:hypothetical protein